MLQELFVKIVSMSLTAIPIVLVVLIARVFLRSKPKIFSYILWGAVLFRLICPFAFEADFSFVPEKIANGEVISSYIEQYGSGVPEIETGAIINNEEIYQEGLVKKSVIPTLSIIWVSGIVVLTVYSMILLVHLKKKLVCSILVRENIYLVDHIETPFVLGLINPKIYLPSNVSEKELPLALIEITEFKVLYLIYSTTPKLVVEVDNPSLPTFVADKTSDLILINSSSIPRTSEYTTRESAEKL